MPGSITLLFYCYKILMQSNVAINYLFLTKDVLFYLPTPATYSTNIKVAKELNWAKELPGSHGSSKYY